MSTYTWPVPWVFGFGSGIKGFLIYWRSLDIMGLAGLYYSVWFLFVFLFALHSFLDLCSGRCFYFLDITRQKGGWQKTTFHGVWFEASALIRHTQLYQSIPLQSCYCTNFCSNSASDCLSLFVPFWVFFSLSKALLPNVVEVVAEAAAWQSFWLADCPVKNDAATAKPACPPDALFLLDVIGRESIESKCTYASAVMHKRMSLCWNLQGYFTHDFRLSRPTRRFAVANRLESSREVFGCLRQFFECRA